MSKDIEVKTWVGAVVKKGDDTAAQKAKADRKKQAKDIATALAKFISHAQNTLSIAIYDFRLEEPEADIVIQAINDRAQHGVLTRIAYFDQPKKRTSHKFTALGSDPAPGTDEAFLGRFHANVKHRAITEKNIEDIAASVDEEAVAGGGHLMHSKYVIVDGMSPSGAIWTGSANFTTDAWTVQDNNIVIVRSQELAEYYVTDFNELWDAARITGTGQGDLGGATVDGVTIEVAFSPGEGTTIDHDLAGYISAASKRVRIASMVISSGTVLGALTDALERDVEISGIYDGGEMRMVEADWEKSEKSAGKLAAWRQVQKHLVAKESLTYTEGGLHNFMHNKCLVVDGQLVATGSFNFSQNATRNAENVLTLHDEAIAAEYDRYIDELIKTYR